MASHETEPARGTGGQGALNQSNEGYRYMRYAIISDLHANWQAWSAVWRDIQANRIDSVVCLGDMVGYGPRPEEVVASVRSVTRDFVLGNHDAAACGRLDPSIFNERARNLIEWTANRLSPDTLSFLNEVPLSYLRDDLLFVHAEIEQPGRFLYIETEEEAGRQLTATTANLAFIGHTHEPLVYRSGPRGVERLPDHEIELSDDHRYLVNVGSVGDPRGNLETRASYVILDTEVKRLYFRKVEFDIEGYRRDLAEVGLSIKPYFIAVAEYQATGGGAGVEEAVGAEVAEEERFFSQLPPPPVADEENLSGSGGEQKVRKEVKSRQTNPVFLVVFVLILLIVAFAVALVILNW